LPEGTVEEFAKGFFSVTGAVADVPAVFGWLQAVRGVPLLPSAAGAQQLMNEQYDPAPTAFVPLRNSVVGGRCSAKTSGNFLAEFRRADYLRARAPAKHPRDHVHVVRELADHGARPVRCYF